MFQVDTARFIAEATSIVRPEGACSDVRGAKELRHENGELKSEEEIDALVNTTCVWGRAQHVDKIVIVEQKITFLIQNFIVDAQKAVLLFFSTN